MSRALRALVSYVLRVLRAPVLHIPRALRGLVPHMLCASRASWPMRPHASHFISPFSLRTLLSRTLSTLCPNITFCALEFPCFTLLFFYLFATCEFLVEFTKAKTNIVLAVILWSDDQYLLTVWFIWIFWNQIRKHIHMKLKNTLVQVKVNLIIKSYSHWIDEIATDLSNTFGT